MSPLAAALRYAAYGLPVLPLHAPDPAAPTVLDQDGNQTGGCTCWDPDCRSAGKHPRTRRGLDNATTDVAVLRGWAHWWPRSNVGIRTGSGLLVLDVDPRHDGDDSLANLEAEHGALATLTVETGGGGLHLYFITSEPIRCRTGIRPGLDARGERGYVVAPPSLHPSGRRWTWRQDFRRIAPAPAWLLELMSRPRGKPRDREPGTPLSPRYVQAAIEAECSSLAACPQGAGPYGGRNNHLNVSGFRLARFVASGHADANAVIRALSIAAVHAGLGQREIERTLTSAFTARGAVG